MQEHDWSSVAAGVPIPKASAREFRYSFLGGHLLRNWYWYHGIVDLLCHHLSSLYRIGHYLRRPTAA
jgi:hypothetical protein